jgi:thioredoxin-related protein
MLTRRSALALALAAIAAPARAASAPTLGEDGLYHFDWYLESFLDLKDDIDTATSNGKRLAIMWGLKGCPMCRRMHEVQLVDPAIQDYVKTNFDIVHLNVLGAREITDLDGERLGEKAFSQRYGIRFTPTIQFLPETTEGLAAKKPAEREVARMAGLLEPPEFLAMFRYVREKGYERALFPDWLKQQAS